MSAPEPTQIQTSPVVATMPRRALFLVGTLVILVLLCWAFPALWYTRPVSDRPSMWLKESTNAPGWKASVLGVDKSAESVLAADALFYAEYSRGENEQVRLFNAKRYAENPNEIGLFVHTPDRCWTGAGWSIAAASPEVVPVTVGGETVQAERRLFVHPGGSRELVYFFGLVGGQSLPYRLDHNLGVGRRYRLADLKETSGSALRIRDSVLWTRLWDSFRERRQLFGAKQLVRISTTVRENELERGDALLRKALQELLVPTRFDVIPALTPPKA